MFNLSNSNLTLALCIAAPMLIVSLITNIYQCLSNSKLDKQNDKLLDELDGKDKLISTLEIRKEHTIEDIAELVYKKVIDKLNSLSSPHGGTL